MAIVLKVFISATTSDLGSYRIAVKDYLWKKGIHPVIQDDLEADYRSVAEILREKIEDCDAVICLIGKAYGAEPRKQPAERPPRSYTQIEYDIAHQLGKPVYHFLSDEDCNFDKKIYENPEKEDRKNLQMAHREAVRKTDPKRERFKTAEGLCAMIGTIRFPDPLEGIPKPDRYRTGRLPAPGNEGLFVGRDLLVARLEEVRETGRSGIVMLHGIGGVGKTTVLWHWLRQLRSAGFPGLPQAFDWSFYSQGSEIGGKVSSRAFLDNAVYHFRQLGCRFLDRVNPNHLGDEVARALLRTGGLMVLDGMEPLQHLPQIHGGRCQDPELTDFLHALARNGLTPDRRRWLLVLSSRWAVPSLGESFQDIPVTSLSVSDGGKLLREFHGAGGRKLRYEPPAHSADHESMMQREFETASKEFDNQPLALVLLATYLIEHHGGQLPLWRKVRKYGEMTSVGGPDQSQYRHAFRIMDEYDRMLREWEMGPPTGSLFDIVRRILERIGLRPTIARSPSLARACRRVLGLVSLFDRPADRYLLDVVRVGETIPGLTDGLTETLFRSAVNCLRRLQLLSPGTDDRLDTHPLIRERFAQRVRSETPNGWCETNARLFRHLSADPPGSIETDADRFDRCTQAIAHGCRAGAFADTSKLYFDVMVGSRDGRDAWKKLASMGDDLAVLSHFFDKPWYEWRHDYGGRSALEMIGQDAGEILNESGFDLFKLCRFSEGERSFEQAVQVWVTNRNWRKASRDTVLLGKTRIALGKLKAALAAAMQAMAYTDTLMASLLEDPGSQKAPRKERMNALFFLGEAHHNLGNWAEAGQAFERAVEQEEEYHRLYADDVIYTARVFQYTNFLLERRDLHRAESRVSRAQKICERNPANHRLDMAYNYYLLGRLLTIRGLARKDSSAAEFEAARTLLESFLKECWEQAMIDGRVIAHLALAELAYGTGDVYSCEKNLTDAHELCEAEDVRRFRCDCLMGYAHFHLWRFELDKAREAFDRATAEVSEMQYFRRAGQLRRIAAEAGWLLPDRFPVEDSGVSPVRMDY